MYNLLQCRLCAELKNADNLININSDTAKTKNLEYKINKCLNLNFNNLHLPKDVCLSCCEKVDMLFEFQEIVRKAQELLYSAIEENKVGIKEETVEFTDQPYQSLNYCQTLLNENNCIKKEEDYSEISINRYEDSVKVETKVKDVQPKRRRKKRIVKNQTNPPSKNINSLDSDELLADRVARKERRREAVERWKAYKWKCCICNEELPSVNDLRLHFTNVHNTDPQYACIECGKTFNSYHYFQKHCWGHRRAYNYKCKICCKYFFFKKNYEIHLAKYKHTDEKHVCQICNKVYKTAKILQKHIKERHELKTKRELYKCETCNKMVQTKTGLKYHELRHKGDKRFICDQCGKNFVDPGSLKSHMDSHSDKKPFLCPQCPKRFKKAQALSYHLQAHRGEKFACEICGVQFTRKAALKYHSSIHTGVLAFTCEFCEKKFRTKQLLTTHRRLHTGERPYTCEECNHSFADSGNYFKHLKGKHGIISKKKKITNQTTDSTTSLQLEQTEQIITKVDNANLVS